MKALIEQSGLPIKLKEDTLIYDKKVFEVEPTSRLFEEAKEVYLASADKDKALYDMYRCFENISDRKVFEQSDVEYDLTVIISGMIGAEYIKTKGHYHPLVPGTDLSYPEVYELIEGKVIYLLQTKPNDKKETDVVIVTAVPGDKVIVPPNYGHVSINIGNSPVVESNIQKRDLPTSVDYADYEYYHGGAMYLTNDGWQENQGYVVKSVRKVVPIEKPEWGLTKKKPLYTAFMDSPEKFKWLVKPQDYDFSDIWEEIG